MLIAWACCPPGMSSKSASGSCQSSRPLWTLSDADSLKPFRGEKTGSLQLAFPGGSESSEHGSIYLHFSLCIQDKRTSHPSVTASEESAAWPGQNTDTWPQETIFSSVSPIEILSFEESKLYQRWCWTDCCPYPVVSNVCCERTSANVILCSVEKRFPL